ncbi:hypothetical protein K7X08_016732 [Anisodus acutangulus]|uniref:Uncharacterized protein n=1 Tax=Anisodus acutangulus TaxID=402998 RepID=A0A9Q1R7I4_9SOLA|nr:hypothetical protein K7X08_016732 [Anisodus acutangulus]
MNKGNTQQSRGGRANENVKKPGNASELNKVDTDKAITINKFDVLSTVNEEDESCKVNQPLEQEDSNKDDVNKEKLSAQDVEDNADKFLNEDNSTYVKVVQTSLEVKEQSHTMTLSNSEEVKDIATHARDSSESEVLIITGGGSPAIITPLSEVTMIVVEEVDMKINRECTYEDISDSPIEETLKADCYPDHSKGDCEARKISDFIADSLMMKENVNVLSILRNPSINKELHVLVSHNMNNLNSSFKGDDMKKEKCQNSDMEIIEEEDLRQYLIDVFKQDDLASQESVKSSKKGRKYKNGGEGQSPKIQSKIVQTRLGNSEPSRIL